MATSKSSEETLIFVTSNPGSGKVVDITGTATALLELSRKKRRDMTQNPLITYVKNPKTDELTEISRINC